jgi:2-dehydropantoate 2-reductase
MRTVAILGPGGVGGFLAGALARAGTGVTVVAREPTARAIAAAGLRVRSVRLGDFQARPAAATTLDGACGALLVATKAVGLDDALERVRDLQPRIVVPLLNGLDHLDVLRERFGDRAVAGTIRIESTRLSAGEIEQTSPSMRIELASADPAMHAPMAELAATLEGARVPVRILDSEAQVMWSKLVRLNALACATSAWGLPVGAIIADGERRAALGACVREGAAVALAAGAVVDAATTIAELREAHPGLRTSMQRDIAAGREPELDAIPGAVLRAGARHGIDCPAIERLASLAAARAGIRPPVAA